MSGEALHADAWARLVEWQPTAGRQARLRDRFVAHLASQPEGMTRACFPDHVTAGVVVLSADLDHVLLNLHRKAQRWFAFGGHCEPGDATLADAALREGLEESGLESLRLDPVPVHLDEHEVGFCDPRGPVRHLDVRFTALAPEGASHRVSEESLDVRWWPIHALPDDLEDEMHELIATARARWASRVGAAAGEA
ncbi:NUDIX hydrolase [Nocardioides daphniae]|uniref:NUDIX domain-containing protein n=1 Tax=Nocardioides daphniae TaxID=402297 RepID=A0A4P7UCD3_9ACTN|nr:NUDIX domain-containing protein [Nocardioides daphniae]QCC77800.1 NUDIX domain-containing protein [Nocardioides daphniae]GGD28240.1 NUDIX hydrolase [Nocardioides daphniae]